MADIRKLTQTYPEIEIHWSAAVEHVQSLIKDRFLHLSLKDEPFAVVESVTHEDIRKLKERYLGQMFPTLDLTKLRKDCTNKVQSYQKWLNVHCQRWYNFQIRKCNDPTCCLPPSTPVELLNWLPDPVLQPDGEHFKSYI